MAQVWHCPPWEAAGFCYEHPSLVPMCWRWWSLDYLRSKSIAQDEKMKAMMRPR